MVINSDADLDNIDYKEVSKYVAVVYSKEDLRKHKVISCVPVRQVDLDNKRRGNPTLAYLDKDTYTRVKDGVKQPGTP